MSMLKRFRPALISLIVGLFIAAGIGFKMDSFSGMLAGIIAVLWLFPLESSMSLDNSAVASGILLDMTPVWRKRYLTFGMLIAVFGMRFAFPIIIVSIAAHISPMATLHMAIYDPKHYGEILESVHPQITAFGLSFLSMISFGYFMNINKEEHWLGWIEKPLSYLGRMTSLPTIITLLILVAYSYRVPGALHMSTLVSGLFGLIAFFLVKNGLPVILGEEPTSNGNGQGGFGTFMYLECVDSSFSFDGVIGAFAITNNIFYIAIGLGIGAMVVRCLTLWLVEIKAKNKNDGLEFPATTFVENGAFFSVLALIICMYYNSPDYITGLIGAVIIGLAVATGVWLGKSDNEKEDVS